MMAARRCLLLCSGAALMLLSGACGSKDGRTDFPQAQPPPPAPPAFLNTLDAPTAMLARIRQSSFEVDEPLFKSGSANDPALPANLAVPIDTTMLFAADWQPGDSLQHAAYCGYRFDLTGYAAAVALSCCFTTAPDHLGQAFIGVANFERNAWDWFAAPLCGTVALDDAASYCSAGDDYLLVVVVSICADNIVLGNIRIGNMPPQATFTQSTGLGIPGTVVTFDATASSDPDGTVYRYRWDPEGDGTYLPLLLNTHGSPTKSVTYSQPGTYHPTLEVTDDSGATDTFSDDVLISLGNFYTGTLDSEENAGVGCSAALVNGRAAVAYMAGDELRFMRALDLEALNWEMYSVIDSYAGGDPDLAVIGGRPAIAYQSGGRDLGYVRANNAAGSSWPTAKIAAYKVSGEVSGCYPALAEIAAQPAIAYGEHDIMDWAGEMRFVRADDLEGASWQSPMVIGLYGADALSPSLRELSGAPTVAYCVGTAYPGRDVYCSRALDDIGDWWNAPYLACGGGSAYTSPRSLLEVAGKPAIGYWDDSDDTLKFVRARQVEGLEWYAPAPIATAEGIRGSCSFIILNGLPCCAYGCDSGLYLVIAKSSLGSSWNEPLCMLPDVTAGWVSLLEIQSLPALAWFDVDPGTLKGVLKFAIYN